MIMIDEWNISVQFQKRAHNPLLIAAGFDKTDIRIPWLGNKRLQSTLVNAAPTWCIHLRASPIPPLWKSL